MENGNQKSLNFDLLLPCNYKTNSSKPDELINPIELPLLVQQHC